GTIRPRLGRCTHNYGGAGNSMASAAQWDDFHVRKTGKRPVLSICHILYRICCSSDDAHRFHFHVAVDRICQEDS
ncbi:hypothetical protein PMAYCL1PPCAC_17184, partial [Pristionchus mayeri]